MFFEVISGFVWHFPGRDDEGLILMNAQKMQSDTSYSSIGCVALDVDFLNRNTFEDSALRSEIIGLFQAQAGAVLMQLRLPMDQKNWLYLTHTLKGAAAAVGAQQLAELAGRWGQHSAPAGVIGRSELIHELSQALVQFNRIADQFQTK
jgi:HPt (histidine-containing phosphotransfer) domain-containing protein